MCLFIFLSTVYVFIYLCLCVVGLVCGLLVQWWLTVTRCSTCFLDTSGGNSWPEQRTLPLATFSRSSGSTLLTQGKRMITDFSSSSFSSPLLFSFIRPSVYFSYSFSSPSLFVYCARLSLFFFLIHCKGFSDTSRLGVSENVISDCTYTRHSCNINKPFFLSLQKSNPWLLPGIHLGGHQPHRLAPPAAIRLTLHDSRDSLTRKGQQHLQVQTS